MCLNLQLKLKLELVLGQGLGVEMAGRWLSSSVRDRISIKRKEVRIIKSTSMDGFKLQER
jgi:hypothetical protein